MNAATSLQSLILTILIVGNQGRLKDMNEKAMLKYGERCRQEHNIPIDKYQMIKSDDAFTRNDPDTKDLLFCIATNLEIMDKDGNFLVDDMLADITQKKAIPWTKDQVKHCAVQQETPGDSAQGFFECLTGQLEAKVTKFTYECIFELGYNKDENSYKELTENKIVEQKQEVTFCVLKKLKVMDSNGNFLLDNMKQIFQYSSNYENFIQCVVNKGTPAEKAYAFFNCLL